MWTGGYLDQAYLPAVATVRPLTNGEEAELSGHSCRVRTDTRMGVTDSAWVGFVEQATSSTATHSYQSFAAANRRAALRARRSRLERDREGFDVLEITVRA